MFSSSANTSTHSYSLHQCERPHKQWGLIACSEGIVKGGPGYKKDPKASELVSEKKVWCEAKGGK